MYPNYKESRLWHSAFSSDSNSQSEAESTRRLAIALETFHKNAKVLADEIAQDMPFLTDHSAHHWDALWHLASVIAGASYEITPLEGFVFGGAILLHDLANSLAAYPNRLDDLKGPAWDDEVVRLFLAQLGRRPTGGELAHPPQEILVQVVQARLRQVHADAARELAIHGFTPLGREEERVYLLEDHRLREMYGPLIGDVASSHHWSLRHVEEKFAKIRYGGPAWHGWEVDALKLACLLRASDAAHLDVHRASTLQMLLRQPSGESLEHWKFQNRLHPPAMSRIEGELEYRSTRPFGRDDREAWWLAYDLLQNITDVKLRGVNRILRRNGRTPFAVGGVAGVDNPEAFSEYVEAADSASSVGTLSELAETIILESWGVEQDEVNGYWDKRTVAYLQLRDGSEQRVTVECYVLSRPY